MEALKKVINFGEELKKRFFDGNFEQHMFYANGNDGTSFDWEANDRLCELGYGLTTSDCWGIKILVGKDGNATAYIYPHGEMQPVETEERKLLTEEEAEALYTLFLSRFDHCGIFDAYIKDVLGVDC